MNDEIIVEGVQEAIKMAGDLDSLPGLDQHLIRDLFLDSLDRVEMIMIIEEGLGINLPDADVEAVIDNHDPTVQEIINLVKEKLS